jgi:hypothetical protein
LVKKFGLFIFIGYAISGGVAHAATYYVSKAGSNSNSCAQAKSASTPKLTIGGGVGCLAAGDELLVRAGTYSEALGNSVPSGTSWSNKVRIAAYPGETVWMNPPGPGENAAVIFNTYHRYIEFDGINMDGRAQSQSVVVFLGESDHLRLQNAWIRGGNGMDGVAIGFSAVVSIGNNTPGLGQHELINMKITGGGNRVNCDLLNQCNGYNLYLATSGSLVDGCDFSDATGGGIHIYNMHGSISGNTVRNTRIYNQHYSGQGIVWGILVQGVGHQIYNNLIYDISSNNSVNGSGIFFYSGSTENVQVYNNTIYNVEEFGIQIDSTVVKASTLTIRNNILYAYGNAGISDFGLAQKSNNLIGINPAFVNAAGGDFHLSAESPARDRGMELGSVSTDIEGVPRPQGSGLDIGAYEYRVQQASTPPTPTGLRIVAN